MNIILKTIAGSKTVQILLTSVTYLLYASVLGLSAYPSLLLLAWSSRYLPPGFGHDSGDLWSGLFPFALSLGLALYLFFITGTLLIGLLIRLLAHGIRPGRYPRISFIMLRWLLYSGLHNLAKRLILPMITGTPFTEIFYRLFGCKMGKNVQIHTPIINDAYLLELADNVVIGGATDISCHLYENGHLILAPVKIGANSLIGAHCYISPGVTIGKNCTIGLNVYLRKNKTIPDGAVITSLGGLPVREMVALEKGTRERKK